MKPQNTVLGQFMKNEKNDLQLLSESEEKQIVN